MADGNKGVDIADSINDRIAYFPASNPYVPQTLVSNVSHRFSSRWGLTGSDVVGDPDRLGSSWDAGVVNKGWVGTPSSCGDPLALAGHGLAGWVDQLGGVEPDPPAGWPGGGFGLVSAKPGTGHPA
ncbi:MAG: hypothetical protein ABI140_05530, partial [Jatrophihabitantaceae bacterium]